MGCRYDETPDEIKANKKAKIDQENKEINKLIDLLRVVDENILLNNDRLRLYYYDRIYLQLSIKRDSSYVEDKKSLLTRILCDICKDFEQNGISIDKYQDLVKWWQKHKEQDEKRSKTEAKIAARASALKKLTKEEKDALGIKD
jgi:DNA-binding transcriptional MerR regulator